MSGKRREKSEKRGAGRKPGLNRSAGESRKPGLSRSTGVGRKPGLFQSARESRKPGSAASGWIVVRGRHPVTRALASGHPVREVLLAEGTKESGVAEALRLAEERKIPVRRVEWDSREREAEDDEARGIAAVVRPVGFTPLEDVLQRASEAGPGLLLACEGIVDPHNLGALIRSADAAGAHGVLVPKRRAVGLTETVYRTSAGAIFHVPVVQVTNLVRALEGLKQAGYWITGASMAGDRTLWEADLRGPSVVVVGSEGKGLSRLVEESCDFLVSVPMAGAVESLNASVAGALFLYEAVRQRRASDPLP